MLEVTCMDNKEPVIDAVQRAIYEYEDSKGFKRSPLLESEELGYFIPYTGGPVPPEALAKGVRLLTTDDDDSESDDVVVPVKAKAKA